MSKFIKLPEKLRLWKISSLVSSDGNCDIYKVSKKDYDGTIINGLLRHIKAYDSEYNEENISFFDDEASFINTVAQLGENFCYLDVATDNKPSNEKYDFYIVSEDLKPLSQIMKTKVFSESEIVDFGIQMSTILEQLESNNIFHGNINPDNIFVTTDGRYKLGGFSDFESKINDMSFVAPEIYRKENADFTTDIYSLGIIMYSMSNDGKLPFESDEVNKNQAVEERFSGKSVSAPKNGGEKLKSVVVIACQPDSAHRWKNAGNIKNALTSIKNEITDSSPAPNPAIIPPASTDFSDNVFEEYDFEEFDETADQSIPEPEQSEELPISSDTNQNNSENEITDAQTTVDNDSLLDNESGFEVVEVTEVDDKTDDIHTDPQNTNDIIEDEDVFDDFAVSSKNTSFKKISETKDYGDFFDDEPTQKSEESKNTVQESEPEVTEFDDNKFQNINADTDFIKYDNEEEKGGKGKRNVAIIIVCVVVILAALGFIAYCILNGFNTKPSNNDTTSPSSTTAAETTKQPTTKATTAPVTTQPTTAAPVEKNVVPVVGYGYSYGKKLLEQEGFTVEISEYRYSTQYEEGYIIEQSPEGDTSAESGSVVYLVISSGLIEETTAEPETDAPQSSQEQNNNVPQGDFVFSNSDSAYLSSSQIDALSDSELQYAINEIYARRGRIFQDPQLNAYFNSKSWYEGKYNAEEFEKNVKFNTYEQKNLQLMIDERKTR